WHRLWRRLSATRMIRAAPPSDDVLGRSGSIARQRRPRDRAAYGVSAHSCNDPYRAPAAPADAQLRRRCAWYGWIPPPYSFSPAQVCLAQINSATSLVERSPTWCPLRSLPLVVYRTHG